MSPRFLGANPAKILSGPRAGERTLPNEEDFGFELLNSLTEDQKKVAIFQQRAFNDIVSGRAAEVDPLNPVGIKYDELTPTQQKIFHRLLDEYLSTMPAAKASQRRDSIKKEELGEIRFGWAGSTTPNAGHYYRIQGKSFLIEYDKVQDNANHIHSVWRDFDGDFGRNLLREHYEGAH